MKATFDLPDEALRQWAPDITEEKLSVFAREVTVRALIGNVVENVRRDMARDFSGADDGRVSGQAERGDD